jgi:dihydropteroate synthase
MAEHTVTQIMGILNVTPDSFYDGGRFTGRDKALKHAETMLEAGADIIDIGGESSRPGAHRLSLQEELDRVMPVLEILGKSGMRLSIDTYKSAVASEALRLGAEMVNDISALRFDPEMATIVADHGAAVVLMHMKGLPETMQDAPVYSDAVKEISGFLRERSEAALKAGIRKDKIILDPGIGFGKRTEDNIAILRNLDVFLKMEYPLLIGASRKRLIGDICGAAKAAQRLPGSLAIACVAALHGAHMLRVHDVAETVQAIKVLKEIC